ncbi:MAG: transcription elongation factor GreA [Eubacteriales bacterium]|nr:transcription elongation factor GreA [Eubacteriales bacterium]
MADIWLTQEEIDKREARLDYLKTTRRLEIAEMLKVARAFGDLSENAEYDAAKNEQAKNEYDIGVLEAELRSAKVISEEIDTDVISVGSVVEIRIGGSKGNKATYRIVGSAEADPTAFKISNESPIGSSLLGHKKGDKFEVHTPGGIVKVEVIGIGK